MRLELRHRALEELDQLALRSLELAPDFLEPGRSIVANLAFLIDRLLDGVLDPPIDEKRLDLAREDGRDDRRRSSPQRFTRDARAAKKRAGRQKIRRCQRCPLQPKPRES